MLVCQPVQPLSLLLGYEWGRGEIPSPPRVITPFLQQNIKVLCNDPNLTLIVGAQAPSCPSLLFVLLSWWDVGHGKDKDNEAAHAFLLSSKMAPPPPPFSLN
jgi:hypothetical protein